MCVASIVCAHKSQNHSEQRPLSHPRVRNVNEKSNAVAVGANVQTFPSKKHLTARFRCMISKRRCSHAHTDMTRPRRTNIGISCARYRAVWLQHAFLSSFFSRSAGVVAEAMRSERKRTFDFWLELQPKRKRRYHTAFQRGNSGQHQRACNGAAINVEMKYFSFLPLVTVHEMDLFAGIVRRHAVGCRQSFVSHKCLSHAHTDETMWELFVCGIFLSFIGERVARTRRLYKQGRHAKEMRSWFIQYFYVTFCPVERSFREPTDKVTFFFIRGADIVCSCTTDDVESI